jgi:peptide/nickel transport system substrate-binding protein
MTTRRTILATGAALTAAGLIRSREARASRVANLVLESEVVILDPHFTTAAITRTFGLHVFDTLFAMDGAGTIRPQMVEAWDVSADRLRWDFLLRDGLSWHDGTPVTAADCVQSLRRWAPRDALGRMLLAATAELVAVDARRFRITLKQPFPLMLDALGKPNAPLPVMLPERLARTPGDQRIAEPLGSGPFRFRADLWRPGNVMVLERNTAYRPRAEAPDFLAGGKDVKLDLLNLRVMPDQSTGANALLVGEIDYMQYLPFDLLGRLEKARGVKVFGLGGIHQFQGNFRLNHAAPPFDDPAIRRVLWSLIDQKEVLAAIGVPDRYGAKQCPSFWMCDAPLSTDAGAAGAAFDLDAARAALQATSYRGQPIVILEVSGSISQTACRVLAQNMKRIGFTVDEQEMDWGTVLARRARREGWHLFGVYSNGTDMLSPLTHFYVASTCADYPGWSCDQTIPPMLEAYAQADSAADRQRIASGIQAAAYALTPNVMWGQFTIPAGYRTQLKDLIETSYPIFWQVDRA